MNKHTDLMKNLLLTSLLAMTALTGYSQSTALQSNNQWLEQQLNHLTFKEGNDHARFRFDDCDARMEVTAKSDNGFNMGFNFGCALSQIEQVSYSKAKSGSAYQLNLQMKENQKNDNLSFSLSTSDEKLMEEIKKRLETSIAACRSAKN